MQTTPFKIHFGFFFLLHLILSFLLSLLLLFYKVSKVLAEKEFNTHSKCMSQSSNAVKSINPQLTDCIVDFYRAMASFYFECIY